MNNVFNIRNSSATKEKKKQTNQEQKRSTFVSRRQLAECLQQTAFPGRPGKYITLYGQGAHFLCAATVHLKQRQYPLCLHLMQDYKQITIVLV